MLPFVVRYATGSSKRPFFQNNRDLPAESAVDATEPGSSPPHSCERGRRWWVRQAGRPDEVHDDDVYDDYV